MNRFNWLRNDQEREEVRQETLDFLAPVFTTNGVLDRELMANRVFFVNALGAYEMKQNGQVPYGTGMVEFQNSLETFLTSEDRILARYQSVAANMAAAFIEAQRQVSDAEIAMSMSSDELEKASTASQRKLDELGTDIKSMGTVINRTEKLVETKILSDLQLFLTVKLPENWKSHSTQYDARFGIADMIKLALPLVSEERKKEILSPMITFLNEFIENQLLEWSNLVTPLIAPSLADMQEELDDKSMAFSIKLDEARKIFTGGKLSKQDKGANKLQIILSLIQGDFSTAIENSAGGNFGWGEFARRYVVQAVINILIAFLIGGGPIGIVALVIANLLRLGINANTARNRLLNGFADNLFPQLAGEMLSVENKTKIVGSIRSQFSTWEDQVTQAARELVQDERQHQQTILSNKKRAEEFNTQEMNRQETLLEALLKRVELIYKTLYNRAATQESLEKLAASITTGQKRSSK